jgi:hypothetical protein
MNIVRDTVNTRNLTVTAKLRTAAIVRDISAVNLANIAQAAQLRVTVKNTQVFSLRTTVTQLQKSISVVKNPTPQDAVVFDPNNLQKSIEVMRGQRIESTLATDAKVAAAVRVRGIPNDSYLAVDPLVTNVKIPFKNTQVFTVNTTVTQLQKQFTTVKGLKIDTTAFTVAKAASVNNLRDTVNTTNLTVTAKLRAVIKPRGLPNDSYLYGFGWTPGVKTIPNQVSTTEVFYTPGLGNLQKAFEVVRGLSNNLTSGNLPKPFEVIRGVRTDNLFTTAKAKSIQIMQEAPTRLNTISQLSNRGLFVSSRSTQVFTVNTTVTQLQKKLEVVSGVRTDAYALNVPKTTSITPLRDTVNTTNLTVTAKLRAVIKPRGLPNDSYLYGFGWTPGVKSIPNQVSTTEVFYTPAIGQLQKAFEVVKGVSPLLINNLQKQFEVVRGVRTDATVASTNNLQKSFNVVRGVRTDSVFTVSKAQAVNTVKSVGTVATGTVNPFRVTARTTQVFSLSNTVAKATSITPLRDIAGSRFLATTTQLQKQFEVVKRCTH